MKIEPRGGSSFLWRGNFRDLKCRGPMGKMCTGWLTFKWQYFDQLKCEPGFSVKGERGGCGHISIYYEESEEPERGGREARIIVAPFLESTPRSQAAPRPSPPCSTPINLQPCNNVSTSLLYTYCASVTDEEGWYRRRNWLEFPLRAFQFKSEPHIPENCSVIPLKRKSVPASHCHP